MTFQKRYLYELLSNLVYNRHKNRLLIILELIFQSKTQRIAQNFTKNYHKISTNERKN